MFNAIRNVNNMLGVLTDGVFLLAETPVSDIDVYIYRSVNQYVLFDLFHPLDWPQLVSLIGKRLH